MAAAPSPATVAKRLSQLRATRSRLKGVSLTDHDIAAAKAAGRP